MINKSKFSIQHMLNLLQDRGIRAYARKFWSPTTQGQSFRVFGRLNALNGKYQITPEMIVIAVYATHFDENKAAHHKKNRSIGASLRQLGGGNEKADQFPSVERHFSRLLASDNLDDLAQQLNRFAKKFKTAKPSVTMDYEQLLWDLRHFLSNPEKTRLRWAADFWQAPIPESTTTPTES